MDLNRVSFLTKAKNFCGKCWLFSMKIVTLRSLNIDKR